MEKQIMRIKLAFQALAICCSAPNVLEPRWLVVDSQEKWQSSCMLSVKHRVG